MNRTAFLLLAVAFAGGTGVGLVVGTRISERMEQMQLLFAGSLNKESVRFLVQRGGSRFEIPMDPKKLMGGAQGVNIEPASR